MENGSRVLQQPQVAQVEKQKKTVRFDEQFVSNSSVPPQQQQTQQESIVLNTGPAPRVQNVQDGTDVLDSYYQNLNNQPVQVSFLLTFTKTLN